jgi:hypothetical protein
MAWLIYWAIPVGLIALWPAVLMGARLSSRGAPDSAETYTPGRDRIRSGLLVVVGVTTLVAAGYTLVDDTIVVRPTLGLSFLAEAAAALVVAVLPIRGSWTPMRINAAGVLGMLWLLAVPLLLIMVYSASGCGCAGTALTYIPPAPFGFLDTRSIALVAIVSPVLSVIAAALPPHPGTLATSTPS